VSWETVEVVGTDLAEEGWEVEVMEAAVLEGHPEGVSRGSVVAVAMDLVEMEVEAREEVVMVAVVTAEEVMARMQESKRGSLQG